MKSVFVGVALAGMALSLYGCAGLVVGAGATAATAAAQERGFKGAVKDTVIRAHINELWFSHDVEMYQKVSLTVLEGRVLLTGKVRTQKMRIDAVRLAWQAKGVSEVINEVGVSDDGGVANFMRDAWISTQLKYQLALDKQVASINYSIETVDAVIYLMGIAVDQGELDRVTGYARNVRYVKKVISYVRLKDDPRRNKS